MAEVLFEYRDELLGMRDMLLDSYFTLFFWNPPNCFMIYGGEGGTHHKPTYCWVSFILPALQESWDKVTCLFSSFIDIFVNIVP